MKDEYRCMVCDELEADDKGIMTPIEGVVNEEVLSYAGHVQAIKICKNCHKLVTKKKKMTKIKVLNEADLTKKLGARPYIPPFHKNLMGKILEVEILSNGDAVIGTIKGYEIKTNSTLCLEAHEYEIL